MVIIEKIIFSLWDGKTRSEPGIRKSKPELNLNQGIKRKMEPRKTRIPKRETGAGHEHWEPQNKILEV